MTAHPILYDPDCGFCRVCVAVVLRWDRHGRLRPVPEAEDLGARGSSSLPDGAAVRAAGRAPSHRCSGCCRAARRWRGSPTAFRGPAERAYRWVADHRSAFGRPLPAGRQALGGPRDLRI